MKYLRKFNESKSESILVKNKEHWNPTIYEIDWHSIAPDKLIVIKGDITDNKGYIIDKNTGKSTNILCEYKIGNIMTNLVHQITYDRNFNYYGIPDTLELDVSIIKDEVDGHFQMNVEITLGDAIVSGFNLEPPDNLYPYIYTSYGSFFDPNNTVFAFDETSIKKLIKFFNKFDHMQLDREDFNFLDSNSKNYKPEK